MLTLDQMKEICHRVSLENTGTPDDADALSEDVSQIIYRRDEIDCDGTVIVDRHIDMEYSFGDYYEMFEGTPLFAYISGICLLPEGEGETEVVLYQEE